jgi:hypothetical protein
MKQGTLFSRIISEDGLAGEREGPSRVVVQFPRQHLSYSAKNVPQAWLKSSLFTCEMV